MPDLKPTSYVGRIYLLRQLMVCSGVWCGFFMFGLKLGSLTVIVHEIRKNANSTEFVSSKMAAWLPSVSFYTSIPWVCIMCVLATYVGRKIVYVIVSIFSCIGFIVLYTSSNVTQIFISEMFQGPLIASKFTVIVMSITEYSSPKYRRFFLTIKGASLNWGVLVANSIGTFFHWRNIALLGIICSIYSLITVFFWPESPYWLATRGRFDECSRSHRWLQGSSTDSEKELEKLIAENRIIKTKIPLKTEAMENLKRLIKREFYIPVLLSMLLISLHIFSGKMVCTVYALVIIKKITSSESTAYTGMLILDAVTVFSMYCGCFIVKKFKSRPFLLISAGCGIMFLFTLSFYLYLIRLMVINENKYVSILLLVGYSVTISVGPVIMSMSISGELIPLKSRSLSFCMLSLLFNIVNGTLMLLYPYFFHLFDLHGTFLCYGLLSSVILVLVYIFVPETKNKTLYEIYDSIKGIKSMETKELLPATSKIIVVPQQRQI